MRSGLDVNDRSPEPVGGIRAKLFADFEVHVGGFVSDDDPKWPGEQQDGG